MYLSEHPFLLVNGSYIPAFQLKSGMHLATINGNKITVISIKNLYSNKSFPVYNLESKLFHDFIIPGGAIVHNSNGISHQGKMRISCDPKVEDSIHILEKYGYGNLKGHYLEFINALDREGLTYDEITFGGTGLGTMETLTTSMKTEIPIEDLGNHPDLAYFFSIENPDLIKGFPILKDHDKHPLKEIYDVINKEIRKPR